MLAYAANRPAVVDRRPHPNAMLAIIGAHVALAAIVMSAKMEITRHRPEPPIVVDTIRVPPPPHPVARAPKPTQQTNQTTPTEPTRHVLLPPVDPPHTPTLPPIDPMPIPGGGATVTPLIPHPPVAGITAGAQLMTPEADRRPPYPASKLLNEEEATLTLRLTIDDRGRVVSVEPVGRADAAFLDAARRHLIAHWRYKPAMEDGHAVSSSAVIRLRFELDG